VGTAAEPHGVGLKNNLAYYVDGDAERAHELRLKLNVNQRQEAKQAQQALMRATKALTQQAFNTSLPKAAEQAIAADKPWRGTLKAATLELVREDWPTGKGYGLK
jgi:anti-sigma factor RsiW